VQADLGDAHQKLGMTEGMIHELRSQCQQQTNELRFLRTSITEGEARKGLLEHELETSRENTARLESQLQERL